MLSQVLDKDTPCVELSSVHEIAKIQDERPVRISYAKDDDYESFADQLLSVDDDEEPSIQSKEEHSPREERTIIHRNERDQPTHVLHQERTILFVPDDFDDAMHPAPTSPVSASGAVPSSGPSLADIETSISGGTPKFKGQRV